jgi:MFS family permease
MNGWAMILWRLPRVQFHSAHARCTFATLVCFTLAASFATPLLDRWLDDATRLPALSLIVEYLFAIAAAVVWALSCLSLDESLLSRRWLLWLAPLLSLAILLTWWLFLPEMAAARSDTANGELLITTLAQGYAFAIVAIIAAPALSSQVTNESALPIRIRLLCILGTQIILAIWLGARIILGPLVLIGVLPRTFPFSFINVLVGLMILAYTASLLPPAALIYLSRRVVHLRDWLALARLRRLERQTAVLLEASPIDVPLAEAWSTPDYSLYRVAIAILDRRKALKASPNRNAQQFAERLDQLVASAPDYFGLLRQLEKLTST